MAKQFAGFTLEQARMLHPSLSDASSMEDVKNRAAANPVVAAALGRAELSAQRILAKTQFTGEGMPTSVTSPMSSNIRAMAAGGLTAAQQKKADAKAAADAAAAKAAKAAANVAAKAKAAKAKAKADAAKYSKMVEGQKDMSVAAYSDPESLVTEAAGAKIKAKPNQFVAEDAGKLTEPLTKVEGQQMGDAVLAEDIAATEATTFETDLAAPSIQKTLDQFDAATATPTEQATIQGQLEDLMQGFEEGKPPPPWAAASLRNAAAMMAQRGLGSSSLAAQAATQAVMESALPIAQADAATFATFELQNLANSQQMAITKMDTITKALFTDQSAENLTRQINATSENQVKQFFASMASATAQFNATQQNAAKQFDVSQANAIETFNVETENQRQQFEVTNGLVIAQSNAKWRQDIATTNTANQQAANMQNAELATGMTTAAINNLWQRERDLMSFAFQASENAASRSTEVAIAKLTGKQQAELADNIGKGKLAGKVFDKVIDKIFE